MASFAASPPRPPSSASSADAQGNAPASEPAEDAVDGPKHVYVPGRMRDAQLSAGVVGQHVRALSRRHRLEFGCMVEVLFMAVLLAVVFTQRVAPYEQHLVSLSVLSAPFPVSPGALSKSSFNDGFINGQSEYFQWLNNVLYYPIFVQGQTSTPGVFTLGPGFGRPLLMFAPLVQLIRVQNASCPAPASDLGQVCYPEFRSSQQQTPLPYLGTSWSSGNGEPVYLGYMGSYPSSGYYFSLPLNTTQAAFTLVQLRQQGLIDAATRFVSVSLSFYFSNTGVVCHLRPVVEISTSGLWLTSSTQVCAPMFTTTYYSNVMFGLQIALVVIEGLFAFTLVWNTVRFGVKGAYPWLSLITDLVAIGLMVAQSIYGFTWNQFNPTTVNGYKFMSGATVDNYYLLQVLYACSILLSAWRFFCFTELTKYGATVLEATRSSGLGIALYFVNVVVISIFYGLCGITVLGSSVNAWSSSFGVAVELLSYMAGEMDYSAMQSLQPFGIYFAPIFLLTFIAVFLWYLPAVLVAVVYAGWRDAIRSRTESANAPRRKDLANVRWYEPLRRSFGLPSRQGFASDYALEKAVDSLRGQPISFVALRAALEGPGGQGIVGDALAPVPVWEDPLTEQTLRVFGGAAALTFAQSKAAGSGSELAVGDNVAMPSITTLRRLIGTLNRLELNARATTRSLQMQLESIVRMLEK